MLRLAKQVSSRSSFVLTEGGKDDGRGGLKRGSSSVGKVENVNCGVCRYFHSED
jgi:hypothetical protein